VAEHARAVGQHDALEVAANADAEECADPGLDVLKW
jgi:hypothetical protein